MHYVSAQGVDEHAINVHYYYYYYMHAYTHRFTLSFLMYMFTPFLSHLGWSINIKTCCQNYFVSILYLKTTTKQVTAVHIQLVVWVF